MAVWILFFLLEMFYDQLTSDYIVRVVLKKVTTDVSSNLVCIVLYYSTPQNIAFILWAVLNICYAFLMN